MNSKINKKYIIKANLVNQSPLLIGGGGIDKTRDVAFIKDWNGKPYLPGTSLAGCLKSYFEERYEVEDDFDFLWGQDEAHQAQLVIDDAYLADDNYTIKIRDGVKIDNASGRAVEHGLYNYESLEPGAKFYFEAEITCRENEGENPERFLNTLLQDFQERENYFQIGALSSFGFGKLKFEDLKIYEFHNVDAWMDYIANRVFSENTKPADTKGYLLKEYSNLEIDLILKQKSAFIARDYGQDLSEELKERIGADRSDKEDSSPDSVTFMVGNQPVLTAKTLKGAFRSQAVTIINTILGFTVEDYEPKVNPHPILDELFGKWIENPGDEKDKTKSLLEIAETNISDIEHLQLHQRVSIDRFTGGAMESRLFNSVPVFPDENEELHINMKLKLADEADKTKAQLGLLLFVIKDLNDKLFSIGGEKSIGRGLFDVLRLKVEGDEKYSCQLDFPAPENWDDKANDWINSFLKKIKA